MALKTKYQPLIDAAQKGGVSGLAVREQNGVLYIDGQAPSEAVRNQLWDIYGKIDPDYRAGDLVMNISATGTSAHEAKADYEEYEVVKGDSLSRIGQQFGVPWKEIFEANKDRIKDPDLIHPGWRLKIPRGSKG